MKELGTIKKIHGDTATVLIKKNLPCGENCRQCARGCYLNKKTIRAKVTYDFKVGDLVEIEVKNHVTVKHNIFYYIIPLSMFFITMVFVQLFLNVPRKNVISVIASLAILIIANAVMRIYEKRKIENYYLNNAVIKKQSKTWTLNKN